MSFLMPSGAMDKVNEATVEFTAQFSKYMLLGFFEVAINQAKANAESKSVDDPEQLMEMPVPDWPLKEAYFTKEGGNQDQSFVWDAHVLGPTNQQPFLCGL